MNDIKWGLLDLPRELFVKIDEGFLKKIISSIGSQHEVARKIGIQHPMLHRYIRGRRISLKRLLKIINLSSESEEFKNELESHIIDIKAPSSRAIEIEPPFPLEMNKALARILGHLLGDGNVRENNGHNVRYGNTDPVLVESFIEDMQSVFLKADYHKRSKRYETNNGLKEFTEVTYPSTIGRILLEMFDYLGTFKGKIPEPVLNLENEIKSEIIKSIFDDEGTITENKHTIRIQITNEILIHQIQNLLEEMDIKSNLNNYKDGKGVMYHLSIYRRKSQKKFFQEIGATEGSKKHTQLEKYINSLKPTQEETEAMITNSLDSGSKTYTDLWEKFPLSEGTFTRYLKILKKKGNIKKNCEGKWELN